MKPCKENSEKQTFSSIYPHWELMIWIDLKSAAVNDHF